MVHVKSLKTKRLRPAALKNLVIKLNFWISTLLEVIPERVLIFQKIVCACG
jgi:hypothetical protein